MNANVIPKVIIKTYNFLTGIIHEVSPYGQSMLL